MIPKIIHYCWFGGNPLPSLAQKCIESWHKFCPDYEIREWNESNYDVHKIPYISQAYKAKKYAFVSDYARFDILYEYGGIYFDTDVEVLRSIDNLISNGAFAGLELPGSIAAGLGIGAEIGCPVFKEIIDAYKKIAFMTDDGQMNLTTVVSIVSRVFKNYGFTSENKLQKVAGVTIYPIDFFCPKNYETGEIVITQNTYTIHHYDGSWISNAQRRYNKQLYILIKCFGIKFGKILSLFPFCIWQLKDNGVVGFIKKVFKKLHR